MPGLASSIAKQIREGEIKKFLIQPVDLLSYLLLSRVAHKLAYYSVATIPFAIVFILCRGFFVDGFRPFPKWSRLFFPCCLGLSWDFFWRHVLDWLLLVYGNLVLAFCLHAVQFLFVGHMFPLDILPEPWQSIVQYLPLKYLAYFPPRVFLGKIDGAQLWFEMGILVAWTTFFVVLSRWLYARGLHRYSGYGG